MQNFHTEKQLALLTRPFYKGLEWSANAPLIRKEKKVISGKFYLDIYVNE